jgi:hypothetical protein
MLMWVDVFFSHLFGSAAGLAGWQFMGYHKVTIPEGGEFSIQHAKAEERVL